MSKKRYRTGRAGEAAARRHLEELGYQIIEQNYRCPLGELDLIARDNETIVFIEVRSRTGNAYGYPEESITAEKARRLRNLALYYLKTNRLNEAPSRIDLIAVMLEPSTLTVTTIRHIKAILSD